MSISLPTRSLCRPETLPTTTTTTGVTMKTKKKRAGSFLCFGPPATDEMEDYYGGKGKGSPDGDRNRKKKKKRLMAKIVRSISMKSSPSREKLTREPSRLTWRKVSDSSENQSTSESFGKKSDAQMFSSSSTSLSSSSFSSSSSSSSSSSVASSMAAAVLPKLQRKKTFLPPPGPRNHHGYTTGLTLVLLSLFVMIFCGRLTAILWTATWLCLLPRRRAAAQRPPPEMASAESRRRGSCCGEEAEKKRVVMEGFLQRNRKGV